MIEAQPRRHRVRQRHGASSIASDARAETIRGRCGSPHAVRQKLAALRMFAVVPVLCILAQYALSQSFPERIYDWTLADSAVALPANASSFPADLREAADAYGVTHVFSATYKREGGEAAIRICRAPDILRGFGLFSILCGYDAFEGIPGDAFLERPGNTITNYGPFCIQVSERSGRKARRVDGAILLALKKMLYLLADCTFMEVPLPDEERAQGGERYLCGSLLTRHLRDRYPAALQAAVAGSCAYAATYRKDQLRVERELLLFVAPDTAARRAQMRSLREALSASARPRESCGIAIYRSRRAVYAVEEAAAGILLSRASPGDPGWCEWIRGLRSSKRPAR